MLSWLYQVLPAIYWHKHNVIVNLEHTRMSQLTVKNDELGNADRSCVRR